MNLALLFHFITNDKLDSAKELIEEQRGSNFNINDCLDLKEVEKYAQYTDEILSAVNCTPLYFATKLKKIPFIQLFLDNGADVKKVISDNDGLFVSAYDYAVLTQNNELTELFNKYCKQGSMLSTRTKTRSQNAPVFNFASNKKGGRGRKPKSQSALGIIQNF